MNKYQILAPKIYDHASMNGFVIKSIWWTKGSYNFQVEGHYEGKANWNVTDEFDSPEAFNLKLQGVKAYEDIQTAVS